MGTWTGRRQSSEVPAVSFLFRPYACFLIPGVLAAIVALGFWIAALLLAIQNSSTSTATVFGAMFTILAAILLGMGVLSAQAKRYFEELFHLGTTILWEERRPRRDEQGPVSRL